MNNMEFIFQTYTYYHNS